jgi:hypothetical protein
MQEMAVSTKINGVDVDRLFETIDAIKQIPRLADFKFRLSNRWINGGLNRSTIKNFYGAGMMVFVVVTRTSGSSFGSKPTFPMSN